MYSMEIGVLLLGIFGVALGNPLEREERATPCYTYTFDGPDQSGLYYIFSSYMSDLSTIDFDNVICSVQQTGMWMYYENIDYNSQVSGQVYWFHGIGIPGNLPAQACGVISSLKYAGNQYAWNEDSFTLYTYEYFVGDELYGNIGTADLTYMSGASSSLILTGLSPWTFYTGYGLTGSAYCFYPSTDEDVGLDGTVLNFGFYPSLIAIGVPENSFFSVQKGCYTANVVKAPQMKADGRLKSGAWGVFKL